MIKLNEFLGHCTDPVVLAEGGLWQREGTGRWELDSSLQHWHVASCCDSRMHRMCFCQQSCGSSMAKMHIYVYTYENFGLEGDEREAVGSLWLLLVWKCRLRVLLRFNSISCFPHSVHKAHPIHSVDDATASPKVFWPSLSSRGRNALRFSGIFQTA